MLNQYHQIFITRQGYIIIFHNTINLPPFIFGGPLHTPSVFSTSPPPPRPYLCAKNTRPCQQPLSFSNIQSSIASRYSDPRRLSAVGTSDLYKSMNMKSLPRSKPCANARPQATAHHFPKSPPTAIPRHESSSSTRPENPP